MVNYYNILGVSQSSSQDQIKKAYRALALKHHPDKNLGSKDSENRFKLITEAYQILSDTQQRTSYDLKLKQFQKQSKTQSTEERLSPETILGVFKQIEKAVYGLSADQINQRDLFDSLSDLLTSPTRNFLQRYADQAVIREIVESALLSSRLLGEERHSIYGFVYVDRLYPELVKLAGADNQLIIRIANARKRLKKSWLQRNTTLVVILSIITIVLVYNIQNSSNEEAYNRPTNGDLNKSFGTTEATPTTLTPEQVVANERLRLQNDGWQESVLVNGQFPSCYNFKPRRSKIDNYLEVQVGGGTDVALKLMNLATDKCVRYVFINRGSTYRINHIPEGTYYVKIGYGKDWYSKVEDGKCIGRFLVNPMYEKGQDLMDFNIQYYGDRYSVPSFSLKLDVVSTSPINTFQSHSISDAEFNL